MSISKLANGQSDRVFNGVNLLFQALCLAIILFPLINVISSSLSSPDAVASGKVWLLPVEPTLLAYKRIMKSRDLLTGFSNSLIYTFFGTILNIVLTIMAAYPLSRKDFCGRKAIIAFFVFTMMFNGGMIPTYLVVRDLGLLDTRWAMILPNALAVWNVMIARTFFQTTIPGELYEAADLDGADDIAVILKVVVPLSAPIIAVLTLFYAVAHWNSYFNGLLYLQNRNLLPLQVVLRNIISDSVVLEQMIMAQTEEQAKMLNLVEALKYAIIVFASVPVLLLYPLVQKHFVKGIMIGSLKG